MEKIYFPNNITSVKLFLIVSEKESLHHWEVSTYTFVSAKFPGVITPKDPKFPTQNTLNHTK